MKISTLTIEMAANVARLRQDMEKAQKTVDTAMGGISKAIKVASGAFAALGVGVSLSALAGWVRGAIDAADATSKMAQKTGLAVKEVAGMQLAFRQSGVSAEQMVPIMAKLGVAITNGSKALDAMGISSRTADGTLKTTRDVMGEVADKFRGYQDGAAKTALAVSLFGEEGAKLLPLLNQGADGLAKYDDMARQLGLTVDKETTVAAEQFNDTLDLVGQSTAGVATQVAAKLLPTLNVLAGELLGAVTNTDFLTGASNALSFAFKGLYSAGVVIAGIFKTIGKVVGGVLAYIVSGVGVVIDVAKKVLTGDLMGAIGVARSGVSQMGQLVMDVGSDIGSSWVESAGSIQRAWSSTTNTTVSAMAALNGAAGTAAPVVQNLAKSHGGAAKATREASEALRERIAAGQSANTAFDEEFKRVEDLRLATEGRIKTAREMLEAIERETAMLGLSNEEREKAVALFELERQGVVAGTEAYDAYAQKIQAALDAKAAKQTALDLAEAQTKAFADAQDKQRAEWQKTADSIEQTLTDALMRGFESGKGFGESLADSIVNTFKTYVAREIAKAITNAIMSAMAAQNWSGLISAALGGSNSGGSGTNLLTGANNASSLYSGYNTLTTGAGSNYGAAAGWATGGMSTANAIGSVYANAATTGMATSSIAASGAGMDALLATNAAYGTAATTGTAAAAGGTAAAGTSGAMAGASSVLSAIPVWGWVAIAAIALWQPMFGRKLKGLGTQLNFDAGEITSNAYKFEKGGWFRSDKTTNLGDNTAESSELIQMAKNVQDGTAAMARAMGYSDDAIRNFTGSLQINFKGAETAEEQMQRVNEAMEKLQWQMFNSVPGLEMSKEKFAEFMAEINASIEAAGISTQGIADILISGMMGRMSESEVGAALSDMVIGGIYESIAGSYASQIASAFSAQIIQPIFVALAAGVPISQAISQQAIANVVATAQQAAAAMNAIFSDPGFRAAISGIQQAISGISGAVTSVRIPSYRAATTAYNSAADAAARAAEETKKAWQSVADSLLEEMQRIRGEILGTSDASQSYAQAQFAIATAQARAGDQDAAESLPGLSQALIDIAEASATSLTDLRLVQGATLASLAQTRAILGAQYGLSLPAFAVGTNYVPRDMLAQIHEGEAIVPKAYNPAAGGEGPGSAELVAELRALRAQVETLTAINRNTQNHTGQTARTLDRVTQGGEAMLTEAA